MVGLAGFEPTDGVLGMVTGVEWGGGGVIAGGLRWRM
jgi:hypothetical protein